MGPAGISRPEAPRRGDRGAGDGSGHERRLDHLDMFSSLARPVTSEEERGEPRVVVDATRGFWRGLGGCAAGWGVDHRVLA